MLRVGHFAVKHCALQLCSLFPQVFEAGPGGQFTRHTLLLFRPGVRWTGKREVMTWCLETGSGAIFSFRGRDAT